MQLVTLLAFAACARALVPPSVKRVAAAPVRAEADVDEAPALACAEISNRDGRARSILERDRSTLSWPNTFSRLGLSSARVEETSSKPHKGASI